MNEWVKNKKFERYSQKLSFIRETKCKLNVDFQFSLHLKLEKIYVKGKSRY